MQRGPRRSINVATPLLVSAAVGLLTACSKPEQQRCVDLGNAVVDEALCRSADNTDPYPPYRYYYGGAGDGERGTFVSDGSFTPLSGHTYRVPDAGTQRGGFGSWFLVAAIAGVVIAFGVGE
jgi:hypothetical protein